MYEKLQFIRDLKIDSFDIDSDIDLIKPGFHIISLNIEQFVLAMDNPELLKVFLDAEMIIPDGSGIVLTLKYLFGKKIKKIAGIDLAQKLIEKKKRIVFIGSTANRIEKLKKIYSEKLVFAHHGYFDVNQKDEIRENILQSQPDLLLVALGSPKQEFFISELKQFLPNTVMMGIGGAFDIWSGELKRAPQVMVQMNLEWFFRLMQEPSRLKRILYNVTKYIFLLMKELI